VHILNQAEGGVAPLQTFIKTINYSHLMPTRYNLADVDLKTTVSSESVENSEAKKASNKVSCLLALCWPPPLGM
jgi:hypothetical protein